MHLATARSSEAKNWGMLITLPLCGTLLILFLLLNLIGPAEKTAVQELDPDWYTPVTARGEDLKNKVMVGNCFLCHAYWTGRPDPDVVRPLFAHAAITLAHGANDRCYNCHLIQDRNKYTANDGTGIMAANVETLCARCHGLIYKDWLAGTHGVRRGNWKTPAVFDLQNFKCTECHDPHSPVFKFKTYAPPPVWPTHFVRSSELASASTHSTD